MTINIAREFTALPGPRYRNQGPGSGQQFLEEHLKPAFLRARDGGKRVDVELDGVRYGYPTSFLEEAFGGLAREFGSSEVLRVLRFHAKSEPLLEYEIRTYIDQATNAAPPAVRAAP